VVGLEDTLATAGNASKLALELELEVCAGDETRKATIYEYVRPVNMARVQIGQEIDVRYDPADRERVTLADER
jgi:pyridoxine 5'-phosphate synthase PdxJ